MRLVLVQAGKVYVQNDVFPRFGNRVRCTTNPTQVHRSLVGVDATDFAPDVGCAKGGVAVADKGEFDIDLLHPFLDDDLDFILLNSVPTNENVGEFLFFKVTVNLQELKHARARVTTYPSVVLHTSGLGWDSSHRITIAKTSDVCFVGIKFSASALERGNGLGFVTFSNSKFRGSSIEGEEQQRS